MFADDTVLLAQEEEDLRWNVEKLNQAIKRHKIKVNWSKQTQWSSAGFLQSVT